MLILGSKNLCPRWKQGKMETVTIQTVNYCADLWSQEKGLFGGLFMPTQHSVPQCPAPSVSGPFSAAKHRGGRGWKQGNWDQSVSRCHYQFCPDNTSTFHFHPRNVGGRGGLHRAEQEMMDMKMSFFFPLRWVDGRKCGVISCQSLVHGQEDTHAEVRPATSLLLISLLNKTNGTAHNTQLQCTSWKIHCIADVCMVTHSIIEMTKRTLDSDIGLQLI